MSSVFIAIINVGGSILALIILGIIIIGIIRAAKTGGFSKKEKQTQAEWQEYVHVFLLVRIQSGRHERPGL